MGLFQKVVPVLDVPERVSAPGKFTDFQGDKVDIRMHGSGNLRGIKTIVNVLNDVIVWQRNLCREEICLIFHRIAGHVKEVEFLKDCGLLSVKLIMADLVQQDNPAHDFMQIRFDEDKAVTFDNLIHTLLPVEVYFLDNNTKFFCNAFRISGSDFADYGIGAGDYGVGAVQLNQYPHLPSLVAI